MECIDLGYGLTIAVTKVWFLIYIEIKPIPRIINTVDTNFITIDSLDVSSPNKPNQIFVSQMLYMNAKKALEAATVVIREAGPRDNAHNSMKLPTCAVIN